MTKKEEIIEALNSVQTTIVELLEKMKNTSSLEWLQLYKNRLLRARKLETSLNTELLEEIRLLAF